MAVSWQQVWPAIVGSGALVVALLVVLAALARTTQRVARLEARYEQLLAGSKGGSLEQVLDEHLYRVRDAAEQVEVMRAEVDTLQCSARAAVQHVGIVRFNPFASTGGDLSFALAAADADGDGVVICSLHGRGDTRVYAKPLTAWQSAYALSDEEVEAIRLARDGRRNGEDPASPPS